MADWAKLIEAVAALMTGLAWPVAIVVAVWLTMRRHRDAFVRLIDRVNTVQFPGGQIDLAKAEAEQLAHVEELTRAVSTTPDTADRQQAAESLAVEAEALGRIRSYAEAESAKGTLTPLEAVALHLYEIGRNYEEIGRQLRCRAKTAELTVERAMAKLAPQELKSVRRKRFEAEQPSLWDATEDE